MALEEVEHPPFQSWRQVVALKNDRVDREQETVKPGLVGRVGSDMVCAASTAGASIRSVIPVAALIRNPKSLVPEVMLSLAASP